METCTLQCVHFHRCPVSHTGVFWCPTRRAWQSGAGPIPQENMDKCWWKRAFTAICFFAGFKKKLFRFPPKRCLCEKSRRLLQRGDVFLLPPALNCVPAGLGAVILHQRSADYFHLVSLVRKWFWHALTPCLLGINMRAMEKLQTVNK